MAAGAPPKATVDQQSNKLITNGSSTGTASASNVTGFADVSRTSGAVIDTLTLGDVVFKDANKNGALDAGEGVSGVALKLFADTGSTAGVWDAGDAQIATATSGANGAYGFAGLAPGDYIVQVDLVNFQAGGALEAAQLATVGDTDPDDNIN